MALVNGGEDTFHSDVTLVSNDGVSVEANLAMLQARCPRLLQRMGGAPEGEPASKRPRTSTESTSASRVDSDGKDSKITVSEASGQALKGLVTFLYSDTLPSFDTEDADSSESDLPSGLSACFELMVTARNLRPLGLAFSSSSSSSSSSLLSGGAQRLAMQRLQGLCEKLLLSHLKLASVIPMLAKAVEAQYTPVKYACHKLLATHKPTSDPAFSAKLVTALNKYPAAMAAAFTSISGTLPAMDASSAPTEIPPSQLPHAMATLWERTDSAGQDSSSSSSSSSKKRSSTVAFAPLVSPSSTPVGTLDESSNCISATHQVTMAAGRPRALVRTMPVPKVY